MLYIPKKFHQVWLGRNSMPHFFVTYQKSWLSLHNGWELTVWNEHNIEQLKYFRRNDFDLLSNFSEKSDYLRFCILLEYGGVYIDTDIECLKNIETIIQDQMFFIGTDPVLYGGDPTINAALFGSIPGHPLVKEIFESFPARIRFEGKKLNSLNKLGPNYITPIIKRFSGNIKIFDSHYFSPLHPKYFHNGHTQARMDLSLSYAIHYYDGHWLPASRKFKRYLYNLHPLIDRIYSFFKNSL